MADDHTPYVVVDGRVRARTPASISSAGRGQHAPDRALELDTLGPNSAVVLQRMNGNDSRRPRMTSWQRTAIDNHCRLAAETLNPKLRRWVTNGVSLVLSVNSGYE